MLFFCVIFKYNKFMNENINSILNKLEDSGYKAYIVGGYVRDKLLGLNSKDVDIITNALPKDIYRILDKYKLVFIPSYGAVKLNLDGYNIDITTFRIEKDYYNNKPRLIEYTNDLYTDLLRRDFTINTICMDSKQNIIDLLDAKYDLYNQIIYVVGNIDDKFTEDKTRMLRAIRLMVTLDFKLDDNIVNYIVNHKKDFLSIPFDKKKNELYKILVSANSFKFIEFVKKYELEKYLGIKINKFIKTPYLIGALSQIEFDTGYNFTKKELREINTIKYLVNKGKIDKYDVYKYGKYLCINAQIILKKSINDINKMYYNLPIKTRKDIDINANIICSKLNINPSKKVGDILNYLEKNIINGKLKNERESILYFLNEGGK